MPAAKPTAGTLAGSIELGDALGSTWQGFRLVMTASGQGEFQHDMWRRAFSAGDLRALFWECQRVRTLERDAARLAAAVAAAETAAQESEEKAAWYRQQLRLESRAGAMLARIFTESR